MAVSEHRSSQAQRAIRNQVQELDALRAHTLTKVMTEERSRYAKVMLAVLDALKTESNYFQRVRIPSSLPPSPPSHCLRGLELIPGFA